MSRILRIIDANANRAREALRVMEEAARFILDDAEQSGVIKRMRHDLVSALADVDGLDAARDVSGDVGTAISTPAESRREDALDVVAAAGARLSEALRAIEEYGKTLDDGASLSAAIEQLRYRGYETQQRLVAALGTGRARQWRLCVLLTESLCRDGDWSAVLDGAIEGGADCVQLREKQMDDRDLLERAQAVVKRCHEHGASAIVNDRPDIALLSGADGVHLGQHDLSCADVRRVAGRRLLIGVSTSNLDEARAATADGADYCGVGPMFPTSTKYKEVIVGPDYLRAYLEWRGPPHLAIGGIDERNIDLLVAAGVRGIAVSSAICGASDPAQVARRLCERIAPAR